MKSKKETFNLEAAEQRASELAKGWTAGIRRLAHYRTMIERVKRDFAARPDRSTEICGCTSFRDFCRVRLNHTRAAVYAMLGGYTAKARARRARYNRTNVMLRAAHALALAVIDVARHDQTPFVAAVAEINRLTVQDDAVKEYAVAYEKENGKPWFAPKLTKRLTTQTKRVVTGARTRRAPAKHEPAYAA